MQGHGYKHILLMLYIFFIILDTRVFAQDPYYYTCAYLNDTWDTAIKVSKVDLTIPAIIDSSEITLRGEIAFKTPFRVNLGDIRFIIAANDGEAAKNSHFLDHIICNYSVLDSNLNQIVISQLQNISLLSRSSNIIDHELTIDYTLRENNLFISMKGSLALERSELSILNGRENIIRESEYPTIGRFRYFNKISNGNNHIFWELLENGMYLLDIDLRSERLIDSLYVGDDMDYSYIFALSSNDSLVYFFHLNSNVLGGPESERKLTVDPSYLLIVDAHSFTPIDSVSISYPSLDYGYTYAEVGSCDNIGPYLVYYFFHGEDYRYFSPAMLFIFDTRTNQATWLRVGWR